LKRGVFEGGFTKDKRVKEVKLEKRVMGGQSTNAEVES
jgi:hypothetical protein